jgi:hypothetical protein
MSGNARSSFGGNFETGRTARGAAEELGWMTGREAQIGTDHPIARDVAEAGCVQTLWLRFLQGNMALQPKSFIITRKYFSLIFFCPKQFEIILGNESAFRYTKTAVWARFEKILGHSKMRFVSKLINVNLLISKHQLPSNAGWCAGSDFQIY